jgi:hypothetical protein
MKRWTSSKASGVSSCPRYICSAPPLDTMAEIRINTSFRRAGLPTWGIFRRCQVLLSNANAAADHRRKVLSAGWPHHVALPAQKWPQERRARTRRCGQFTAMRRTYCVCRDKSTSWCSSALLAAARQSCTDPAKCSNATTIREREARATAPSCYAFSSRPPTTQR